MRRQILYVIQAVMLCGTVLLISACNNDTPGNSGDIENDSANSDDSGVTINDTRATDDESSVITNEENTTIDGSLVVTADDSAAIDDNTNIATIGGGAISDVINDTSNDASTTTNAPSVTTVDVVSVTPREAIPGEIITVSGRNFGDVPGLNALNVNSVTATEIISWSDTEIVATVPDGVTTGDVSVSDGGASGIAGRLVVPWLTGNPDNVLISSLPAPQQYPQLAPDGSHGAIITWMDWRNSSTGYDIYAQRVNSLGYPLWPADDGVAVSTAQNFQMMPQIVSDASGGAIIVWKDKRNDEGDIYAQRIDKSGVKQWGENGIAISAAGNIQNEPRMIADGNGGAIIIWEDARNIPAGETTTSIYSNWDIYAQRINHTGEILWSENGVDVTAAAGYQRWPDLISDGEGGVIVTWEDQRSGTDKDIYAQRINSVGEPQWDADGTAISVLLNTQQRPRLTSDGSDGAIIVWDDSRNVYGDIYAQRVNGSGVVQWTTNGVAISSSPNHQIVPTIASDGMGGAIITWMDERNAASTSSDIYAQKINGDGLIQWLTDGVPVCTSHSAQSVPKIISDDTGGATILWEDFRNNDKDLYAQRVDSTGTGQWLSDGIAVSSATGEQSVLQTTPVSDGVGGVIVTWQDLRNGHWDIYAQGITYGGRQQW